MLSFNQVRLEVKGKADSFEVPKTQLPISTEYCGEEKMVVVGMIKVKLPP